MKKTVGVTAQCPLPHSSGKFVVLIHYRRWVPDYWTRANSESYATRSAAESGLKTAREEYEKKHHGGKPAPHFTWKVGAV